MQNKEFDLYSFSNVKQWRIDPETGDLEKLCEYANVSTDPIFSMKIIENPLRLMILDYNSTPIVLNLKDKKVIETNSSNIPMLQDVNFRQVITWDMSKMSNYLVFANGNEIFLVPLMHVDEKKQSVLSFGTNIEKSKDDIIINKVIHSTIISVKCDRNEGRFVYALTIKAKIVKFVIDEKNNKLVY